MFWAQRNDREAVKSLQPRRLSDFAAKRLNRTAQGFSPGLVEKKKRPESGARRCVGQSFRWFDLTSRPPNLLPLFGPPFRANSLRAQPRAEALGYDLQPLRGKQQIPGS